VIRDLFVMVTYHGFGLGRIHLVHCLVCCLYYVQRSGEAVV
jgi:hypothetical protein